MAISKLSKEQIIYNITYILKNSKDLEEAEKGISEFLNNHLRNS